MEPIKRREKKVQQPLNPLFKKKTESSLQRKQPITKAEGRKERIDKKKDIKIPFSEEERKLIKKLARASNLTPTTYCTALMKTALQTVHHYPEITYDAKGAPYPVKLEKHFHDKVFDFTVEWDCSLKQAAYRIISYMLREGRQPIHYD